MSGGQTSPAEEIKFSVNLLCLWDGPDTQVNFKYGL